MPRAIVTLLATLLLTLPARACTIPVFRYALEHWDPSPSEIVIFTRGPLADADQKLVDDLSEEHANITLRPVDLAADPTPQDQAISKTHHPTHFPWAVIRYPESDERTPATWSGRLSDLAAQLDSPARRELTGRLLAGQSCVWVLLESGDKPTDDRLAARVDESLKKLETTIELPEIDPEGPQLHSPLPLKLSFSLLRVARSDPKETAFVQMLKVAEPDLSSSTEPLVIPVLGRGRAISALAASHVNDQTLTDFAQFICGQCSCEVKDLNPGIDLLLTADWNAIFEDRQPPNDLAAPRAGVRVPIPVAGKMAALPPLPPFDPAPPPTARPWLIPAIAAAALLALVSGAFVLRARRR
jgi:hypothetical protein